MHRRARAPGLLAAMLVAAASLGPGAPATAQQALAGGTAQAERDLRVQMQLPPGTRLSYRDAAGRAIDIDAFLRAASDGQRFVVERDGAAAVLRLRAAATPAAAKPASASKVGPHIGQPFPAFRARTLDGRSVGDADFAGKYTLVSFFFADCPPCIAEVPELNAFRAAHPQYGTLAITFDDPRVARAFVARRGLTWPVLADAQALIDRVGVRGYPVLALVGPDGRVRSTINAWVRRTSNAKPIAVRDGVRIFKPVAVTRARIEAWLADDLGAAQPPSTKPATTRRPSPASTE